MKPLGRFFFRWWEQSKNGKQRRRKTTPRLLCELLEDRLAPAVLPPPLISDHFNLGGGLDPQVVMDPTNPDKIIVVASTTGAIVGDYTIDGGLNWSGFAFPGKVSDLNTAGATAFAQATDPSVAFERTGFFYVTHLEHDAAVNSGELRVHKFDFTGDTPVVVDINPNFGDSGQTLYRWIGQDPALNPTIALDNNIPSFTDAETGDTQIDTMVDPATGASKAIYIAWNTNATRPNPPPIDGIFREEVILISASADGGLNWSTPQFVSDGGYRSTNTGQISPEILFTQATVDRFDFDPFDGIDSVEGGHMLVVSGTTGGGIVVDDFQPDGGVLVTDPLTVTVEFSNQNDEFIGDAIDGPNSTPDIPGFGTSTINVDITNMDFDTLVDLDVTVGISHLHMNQVRIRLIAPNGDFVTLVSNRTNGLNQTDNNFGLPDGANLGVINSRYAGTVFNSDAPRNIHDAANIGPYIAHYRPESGGFGGGLNMFNGLTAAELNGIWTLEVRDSLDNGTGFIDQRIEGWSLKFVSRMETSDFGFDNTVGGGTAGNAADAPFPTQPTAAPTTGVGPAITVVQDKTLGSFSPYQGRIYIGFATGGDVALISSDDGGQTFFNGTIINDDSIADNFSEGNRTQFQPSLAVDQTTGTLVVTFYDARYDASNGRVARMITTSLDGGETFSEQVYMNRPKLATDAITQEVIAIEPIPDNMTTVGALGFGDNQGLVVHGGKVYSIWTGNENGGGTSLLSAVTTIAAGPRIVSGDMGAVVVESNNGFITFNNTFEIDGRRRLDGFTIIFDRPIDPTTFDIDDVTVMYRDPFTNANLPGQLIDLLEVTPLVVPLDPINPPPDIEPLLPPYGPARVGGNGELAMAFFVRFATPQSGVGTYSYQVGPSIRDKIRTGESTVVSAVYSEDFDSGTLGSEWTTSSSLGTGRVLVSNVLGTPAHSGAFHLAMDNNNLNIGGPSNLNEAILTLDLSGLSNVQLSFWHKDVTDEDDALPATFVGSFNGDGVSISADGITWHRITQLNNLNSPVGVYTRFTIDLSTATANAGIALGANFRIKFQQFDQLNFPDDGRTFDDIIIIANRSQTFTSTDGPINFGGGATPSLVTSSIVVPPGTFGATEVVSKAMVNLNLDHQFGNDVVITLIAPDGTRIVLSDQNGFGQNFTDTTFDDDATTPIGAGTPPFTGSFQPDEPLSQLIGNNLEGTWQLEFDDVVAGLSGTFLDWSISLAPGVFTNSSSLGNFMDQNQNTIEEEADLDSFITPRPLNDTPFALPYDPTTLPLILPGVHVVDTSIPGVAKTSDNLVLNSSIGAIDITFNQDIDARTFTADDIISMIGPRGPILGPFTITANPPGTPAEFAQRRFRISFPTQTNSGYYAIVVGPDIFDKQGIRVDTNFNAGLDVLRGSDPSLSKVVQNTFENNVATTLVPGRTIITEIDVNDLFVIQQSATEHIQVQLNISHPFVPNLEAKLIAPDGTEIQLFTQVGGLGSPPRANFSETIFDDFATTPIQLGAPPFSGTFNPQLPLSILNGKGANGKWQLAITNNGTQAGVINKWDLRLPSSTPSTGLGEEIADQFTVSFRIFTQDPTNEVSSAAWTAIGPEPITFKVNPQQFEIPVVYSEDFDPGFPLGPEWTTQSSTGNGRILVSNTLGTPTQNGGFHLAMDSTGGLNLNEAILTLDLSGLNDVKLSFWHKDVNDDDDLLPAFYVGSFNADGVSISDDGINWHRLTNLTDANSPNLTYTQFIIDLGTAAANAGISLGTSFRIKFQQFGNFSFNGDGRTFDNIVITGNDARQIAGRASAVAVDPSDSSGNTVYIGGASGGVWKTTNFLTNDPDGPTWIPLTDFGPAMSLNIGSITIFPRNNDPDQSIIFVGTGEGNAINPTSPDRRDDYWGVGLLRSTNGGKSWQVLDGLRNADANGVILPMDSPLRDHSFVGTVTYKVVVDPKAGPSGEPIIYMALTDPQTTPGPDNGGIYRSVDGGLTWVRIRAGDATDVVLGAGSAGTGGNLQVLYAAFQGEGVFFTSGAPTASSLTPLPGLDGVPIRRNIDPPPPDDEIPLTPPLNSPSGLKGRIALAAPVLTGQPLQDTVYQGWLYAVVSGAGGNLDGLYVTKDFGRNWTEIQIPAVFTAFGNFFGSNNETRGDIDHLLSQGNYNLAIAIDPQDPDVVYIGGATGAIRVDISKLGDPWAMVTRDHSDPGGPLATGSTQGPAEIYAQPDLIDPTGVITDPRSEYYNLLRDPDNPFLQPTSFQMSGISLFNNAGDDAFWQPFDAFLQSGQQFEQLPQILAFATSIDPITGLTRVIAANDFGVATGVDSRNSFGDPSFHSGIGFSVPLQGERNGNLQLAQFYSGAGQPSTLAADLAQSYFYGASDEQGTPFSAPDILSTGNLEWQGHYRGAESVDAALDGSGDTFRYVFAREIEGFPISFVPTDFFQYNPAGGQTTSRTSGLLQAGDDPANGLGQWPGVPQNIRINPVYRGSRFAFNPFDPTAIVISPRGFTTAGGSIFLTSGPLTGKGIQWFEIGAATDLDSSYAQALAFGAPAPASGQPSDFIYAGTVNGNIFVTFNGGGPGAWTNISAGLDGSPIREIATRPAQGSREAYAVTERGVYFIEDSNPNSSIWNPASPNYIGRPFGWTNITGNLFQLKNSLFHNPNITDFTMKSITSIAADWRNLFSDNPNMAGSPTHPVLYVGGDAGVYRSKDKGVTWTFFPSLIEDNATEEGGLLPNVRIEDLDLIVGNINPTTGLPDQGTGPNLLLATTFGRGSWVIRIDEVLPPSAFTSGPAVTNLTATYPSSSSGQVLLDVTFDGPVDPTTFTTQDVVIIGPGGISVPALKVEDVTVAQPNIHNRYRITFNAPLSGNYTVTIGQFITDFAGNRMNQNGDGFNGDNGDKFVTTFSLTINTAPTISDVTHKVTNINQQLGPIAFTIGDTETPAANLTLSATSSNQAVVTNAAIVFGGAGANRTVTITPVAGQTGVTFITLNVMDAGGRIRSDTFEVLVTNTVTLPFSDSFTRPNTVNFLGTGWNQVSGSWKLVNGSVQPTSAPSVAVLNGVNAPNVILQTNISVDTINLAYGGLVARYSGPGATNFYSSGLKALAGGQYAAQIWRNVSGTWTLLGEKIINLGAGKMRFEVINFSLKLFLNDTLLVSVFDDVLTTGSAGMYGISGGIFDNFTADVLTPLPAPLRFEDTFDQTNVFLSRFWSELAGDLRIENNQLKPQVAGNSSIAVLNGVNEANVTSQMDIVLPTTGTQRAGLMARYQGGLNGNMYLGWIEGINGVFRAQIFRRIGGVWTKLVDRSVATGTGTLRFDVEKTSLKLFLNGQLVAFAHDTGLAAAGTVGIWTYGNTATIDTYSADFNTPINPALSFTDMFNSPPVIDLNQLNNNWLEVLGNFRLVGDQVRPNTPNASSSAIVNGVNAANVAVQANIALPATGHQNAGLLARYQGGLNGNTYLAWIDGTNNVFLAQIWKRINGTWTKLAQGSVSSGTGLLRFEVEGPSLKLFFGNQLVTAQDNSITAPGTVGIWSFGTTAMIDNFNVALNDLNDPGLPFGDNFNQGATQLNQDWVEVLGNFRVEANQLRPNKLNSSSSAVVAGINSADVFAQMDIVLPATGRQNAGLLARHQGGLNANTYLGWIDGNNNVFKAEIWKRINGTWTKLAEQSGVAGAGTLRFEVVGTSLKLFLADTLVAFAQDGAIAAGGTVGIWAYGDTAVLDTFSADEIMLNTPSLQYVDNFNNPPVTQRGQLSRDWIEFQGNFRLAADQAIANKTNGTSTAVVNNVNINQADVSVQANIALDNTGRHIAGLMARNDGTTGNSTYLGMIDANGGVFKAQIWKRVNGAWTKLTDNVIGAGTGLLRFEVLQSSLKLFLGGDLVAFAHDTSLNAGGTIGMYAYGDSATFDDFDADVINLNNPALTYTENFDAAVNKQLDRDFVERQGNFSVDGGEAQANFTNGTSTAVVNNINASDVSVQANITLPGSGRHIAGLLARTGAGITFDTYLGLIDSNNGVFRAQIWKRVNGSWTKLDESVVSSGTGLLRFEVQGNNQRLFLGANQVASSTDNNPLAGGAVGLYAFNDEAVFDNFQANAI